MDVHFVEENNAGVRADQRAGFGYQIKGTKAGVELLDQIEHEGSHRSVTIAETAKR